jgi:VTC domain
VSKPDWADARLELKSVVPEKSFAGVAAWIKARPETFRVAFPDRTVNNVYMDTPALDSWADNVAGLSARVKVRLRWYGPEPTPSPGQLEVKLKRNKLGLKLNFDAPIEPVGTRWSSILRNLRDCLVPEGAKWLSLHSDPVLLNRYVRRYLVSNDGKLRVTFDFDHEVRDQRHSSVVNLRPVRRLTRYVVVEVKCAATDATSASRMLASFPARLSRFSKYSQGLEGSVQ